MQRKMALAFLLLLPGLAGCQQSPRAVVEAAMEAAAAGDVDGYLEHLTLTSAAMVRSLASVERMAKHRQPWFSPRSDLRISGTTQEVISTDRARVTVTDGSRQFEVVLQQEDDRWRINLLETSLRQRSSMLDIGLDSRGRP